MSCSLDEEDDDVTLKVKDDDFHQGGSAYEGFSEDSEDDVETGSGSESAEGLTTSDSKSDQPPPSEWIEFNKKVISMRPLFKSAKVQFANKSTRQMKMLRNRKGDEGQVEKCRRKADRLVEEISYVNRLKQDIVAKFALLHSKEEIMEIVNDPDSSMEYRVKAKVATMPKISKAADDYHQMHPDWRETLIKLIQLAGSKMKKKRRRMRGKGKTSRKKKTPEERANEKKPIPRKVEAEDDGTGRFDESNFPEPPPDLENVANTDSADQGSSCDENEWNPPEVRFGSSSEGEASSEEEDLNLRRKTFSGVQKNRQIETIPVIPKEPTQKRGPSNERSQQKMQKTVVERKLKEAIKRKGDNLGKSREKMSKIIAENAIKQNSVVRNNTVKETKKMLDSDGEQSESDIKEPEESSDHHRGNVDPFFMTSDNKEFKTLWKVEPADSFKNKDKDMEQEPVFGFKNARTYQEVISGKPAKWSNKTLPNKKDKKHKGNTEQGPLDPAKLHPSWQAKKKLNLTAVPFQGKKIVFDD